jgi:hypothetical protein
VKQFLHILFLGISILFSFGFTSFQSACKSKVEAVASKYACCKNTAKKNHCKQNVKSDSFNTDSCKSSCCIESVDLFQFTDFVFHTGSINLDDLEISLLPSIHVFLLSLVSSGKDLFKEELIIPPDQFIHKLTYKRILLKKQSWLI